MKGLTKTIVALALVIAVLATMGMSAMAASYTTKTTYVSATEIQVEATANDLEPGDIVTYVATTDSGDINENTIVYLNQDVEDDTPGVTFNYTTNVTNIDAKMLFGGSTEPTRVEEGNEYLTTEGYNLNVKITGKDPVVVIVPEQNTTAEVVRKIELGSTLLAGMKVKSLEVNGITITDGFAADADTIIVKTDAINADNLTLIVNAVDDATYPPTIGTATALTDLDADGTKDAISVYAKALGADCFGVIIYNDQVADPASVITEHKMKNDTYYVILPALGKNNEGVYSVELQNYTDWISAPVNVKSYTFANGTAAVSSETVTLAE